MRTDGPRPAGGGDNLIARVAIEPTITIAPTPQLVGEANAWFLGMSPEHMRRTLADMAGDATLIAREDYVEEAWRIVDAVLKAATPVVEYEKGNWGPDEVE